MRLPGRFPILALVALVLIAGALAVLLRADAGVRVSEERWGATPVTVYRPNVVARALPGTDWSSDRLPVVVLSHGFAGSQQLMQSYAVALARNGYLAVTFDYFGHGAHPEPLGGDVTQVEGSTRLLLEQTQAVVDRALSLPGAGGGLALLGHSMASDVVVRQAKADARVRATIAVSLFSPAVTSTQPGNLLIVVGAWEGFLVQEALRVVGLVADSPRTGVTYGDVDEGTARRVVIAPWVEHIGVLYSGVGQRETVAWLNAVFERKGTGYVDRRGPAVAVLLLGLVLLAWPLSRLLPRVAAPPRGCAPPWRALLPAALVPAVATPLLLAGFPADFLGMLVGGYLAMHFLVYGLLTAACLLWIRRRRSGGGEGESSAVRPLAAAVAAVLATVYAAGGIGWVMDRWVTSFAITPPRLPLLGVMFVGTLAYFLADEWLVRGEHAPRGAHLLTRVCFLLSLGIAVALSFEDLFFLLIIAAAIIPYFLLYGLLSGWTYRATGHPFVSALPSAVAFAWTLAAVFPFLSGT